jgi:hypothetical protein
MSIKVLNLQSIRIDGGTQARTAVNNELVVEYAAAMTDGVRFPEIECYFDGVDYWLVDGFHRYLAMLSLGKASATVMVFNGSLREAVLHSLGVNSGHGLRKSSDDKRKSVQTMLNDPEWSQLSDREIAKHCGCAHPLVGQMRNPKPAAPIPAFDASGSSTTLSNSENATNEAVAGVSHALAATEKVAPIPTAKQLEAEQNAADAHGDADPIAMLEEAEKQISTLQAELFALQADDQKAETLKFKRLAEIANRRQNELMETVNAREKELQRQANWLRRIGVAVGEDDNSKLAAKVEALARTAKV